MLAYHFHLAFKSIKASLAFSALTVLLVVVGVSGSAVLLAIHSSMSGDPLPGKSDRVFHVQIDTRTGPARQGPALDGLSYSDASELARAPLSAVGTALTYTSTASVKGPGGEFSFSVPLRGASVDFFEMFEVPLLFGRHWTAEEEEANARVAIVSRAINDRLFGGDGVNKEIVVNGVSFRVVGIMQNWRPAPKFFDMTNGAFSKNEDVYLPIAGAVAMRLVPSTLYCWSDPGALDDLTKAPCGWVQSWTELNSSRGAMDYEQRLVNQLRDAGLDDVGSRVRVIPLNDWIAEKGVIPEEIKLQGVIAFAVLVMCAVNMAGIMLIKYHDRGKELAIRRALGASFRTIAAHIWFESLLLSMLGVAIGIGVGLLILQVVKNRHLDYSDVLTFDLPTTFIIATIGLILSATGSALALVRVHRTTMNDLMGR